MNPSERIIPVVIMPTFNNSGTVLGIVQRLAALSLPLFVVNDGSTDATADILAEAKTAIPVLTVLTHPLNRGKAAALRTGFTAAAAAGFTHAVTIDSDGQLDPEQVPDLLAAAAARPQALVLGMRDAHSHDYPAASRWGRLFSNLMIRLECGARVSDSQCGFRVYPLAALQSLSCGSGRFGYETEIIVHAVRVGCPIAEVPVNCRYFPGDRRITHFRPWRDSLAHLNMHARLLLGMLSAPCPAAPARPAAPAADPMGWPEALLAFLLLALGFALRFTYIYHSAINSDEPQHLHVVWAWSRGMIQYRDVFDNHMPLFHMMFTPLVRLLGERPDLLFLMRLAMLPLYALTLVGVYLIGRALFSPRIGVWTAVLTGLLRMFFVKSVEFRTDDLWALLFIWTVAVLVSKRLRPGRAFVVGLLLGATIGVSLKTVLMLAALLIAAAVTRVLCARTHPRWRLAPGDGPAVALALVLGTLFFPVLILGWFYLHGAYGDLIYGAIQHNMVRGLGRRHANPHARLYFYLSLAALVLCARWLLPWLRRWRRAAASYIFVFLVTGVYLLALAFLWPLVPQQDYLPVWPLLVVVVMPLAALPLPAWGGLRRWFPASSYAVMLLLAVTELTLLVTPQPWQWSGSVGRNSRTWRAVLKLTAPNDYVLDPKGEMIFRKRAFYWGLEEITQTRLRKHKIDNTIDASIIKNRACVIFPDLIRYPNETKRFITENFVSVGPVLVAGRKLRPPAGEAKPIEFDVKVPARYKVVVKGGAVARGKLDGQACSKAEDLAPGHHVYAPAAGEGEVALVWARAVDCGYSPF